MPLSSSTVATQSELEPDMGGVSAGSMMIQAICARGSFAGTSRLTWRNRPPRGSLRTKLRSVSSRAIQRDCSQMVSPGGGATPPTITSPTSPSAWQLTTWMILFERMLGSLWVFGFPRPRRSPGESGEVHSTDLRKSAVSAFCGWPIT
ncbi:hypothetical protein D9M69_613680 [compost metagenome]